VKQGLAVLMGFGGIFVLGLSGAALAIVLSKQTSNSLNIGLKTLMFVSLGVLGVWWHVRMVPRFCRVRIAPSSETLSFPISLAESQRQL
jgi:hypothetical protein